jgi:hypothetical protein
MLSSSTWKVVLLSKPRLMYVNIPVIERRLPVVGMGFLFFHFLELASKEQERLQFRFVSRGVTKLLVHPMHCPTLSTPHVHTAEIVTTDRFTIWMSCRAEKRII